MQLQNEIVKKHTPIKSLLIDWLIIFGTYLFIRIFFALFGLHQNIVLLGCCLAILPYLFGALYLQKSHKQCQLWLAALAILIPSVVEKAAIYLFGAYLYNLRPINVVGVMEAIKSNAPYTNFIKNQSAQNLINLSYFNWTYILCSIAISVLVILLLHKTKQKSNKGYRRTAGRTLRSTIGACFARARHNKAASLQGQSSEKAPILSISSEKTAHLKEFALSMDGFCVS